MDRFFTRLNAMSSGDADRAMPHYLYGRRAGGEPATVKRMPEMVRLLEPDSRTDHMLGPYDAPATVIEYGDFECPRCKQAAGALRLLFARFDQRVRFVFRHYPLEEFHPRALQAAKSPNAPVDRANSGKCTTCCPSTRDLELWRLHGYARRLGLDMARFTAAIDGEVYLQRVREHRRSGEFSRVRSTPTSS